MPLRNLYLFKRGFDPPPFEQCKKNAQSLGRVGHPLLPGEGARGICVPDHMFLGRVLSFRHWKNV